jgi:hypothetical protein
VNPKSKKSICPIGIQILHPRAASAELAAGSD